MRKESQATIARWSRRVFGEPESNFAIADRADDEMCELLDALDEDDNNPEAAAEIADVVIVLYGLAARLGVDLRVEVNRKMQINRGRTWKDGQHVEGPPKAKRSRPDRISVGKLTDETIERLDAEARKRGATRYALVNHLLDTLADEIDAGISDARHAQIVSAA
jgi:NTP pyrophosphatase (non-canonical NTP hydrolase)